MTNGENPAYPVPEYTIVAGLTKRELFAAMAMQGMVTNDAIWQSYSYAKIAEHSIEQADALIEQLNK